MTERSFSSISPPRHPFSRYLPWLQPIVAAIVLLLCLGFIVFRSGGFSGNDSFFHIKYARLLWEEGHFRDFPWLQATPFRNAWVDHEFLFHLLLIPFTWFGDLIFGAKVAAVFWAAAALFAAYMLIRSFGERADAWRSFAWIWAVALVASSSGMIYRLSLTRVQSVSLLFFLAAIFLMEKQRYRLLLPLGFLFAWLYNGSVVLVPIAILYTTTRWMSDRRFLYAPCLYTLTGLTAGFILNPYFPDNMLFLWHHLQEYLSRPTPVPVSMEWIDYPSWLLFNTSRAAWIFLLVGVLALLLQGRVPSRRSLFLFFVNLLFLVLFFRARRFIEYWPVFALLFSGSALQESRPSLLALTESYFPGVGRHYWPGIRMAALAGVIVLLSVLAFLSVRGAMKSIREGDPVDRFVQATNWLKAHTPRDSIVFNAQWDVFPDLFFYNHHNRWIAGLNEAFIYHLEPRLWHLYRGIAKGNVEDTARFIKQDFQADYVLALKSQKGITESSRNPDNGLQKVWEDADTVIYRVHPSDRLYLLEGEYLPLPGLIGSPGATCRREQSSPCRDYGEPSAGAFLLCENPNGVVKLTWKIPVPSAGRWKVEGRFLQGPQETLATVRVNEQPLGELLTLKNPSPTVAPYRPLGELSLDAGTATLEVFFSAPSSDKSPSFGLDALRLTRRSAAAARRDLAFAAPSKGNL